MNVTKAVNWFAILLALATLGGANAWAQTQPAATSAGPGRITCRSATACELDVGTSAGMKYKIDPSALPSADKDRLTKQCTAKGTPCIATVTGSETSAGVKAASIKFYN